MNLLEIAGAPDPDLKRIWDRIPDMKGCQGRCHTSCGPVPVTGVELAAIEGKGKTMKVVDGANGAMTCSLLTDDGRCSVYDVRPLMCRAWGTLRSLECPYGCEPESYITDQEIFWMLQEATRISNEPPDAAMENMLEILGPVLARVWEDEIGSKAKAAARESIRTGQPVVWKEGT